MPKKPKNHYKVWDRDDIKQLKQFASDGVQTNNIANQLKRSVGAIRSKANKEGVSLKPKD